MVLDHLDIIEQLLNGDALSMSLDVFKSKVLKDKQDLIKLLSTTADLQKTNARNMLLADFLYQLLKTGSEQCYYCGNKSQGRNKGDHIDHLEYYNKHERVSRMRTPWDTILEIFKGRLVCSGCHKHGGKHDPTYDALLERPISLVYGKVLNGCGNDGKLSHKMVTDLIDVFEIQLFLEEGKREGGFNGLASYATLRRLVWDIFGINVADLYSKGEEYYNTLPLTTRRVENRMANKRKRAWNEVFTQILIKLTGRCKDKCNKCFLNRHPNTRSGVDIHHINTRAENQDLMPFDRAQDLYIDTYIRELKKGNAEVLCTKCHSEE